MTAIGTAWGPMPAEGQANARVSMLTMSARPALIVIIRPIGVGSGVASIMASNYPQYTVRILTNLKVT